MSAEARLQTLVDTYRAQHGDAGLANPVQLAMALGAQAPDLNAEIRALAAAIGKGAQARIAASANPEAEAATLAGEIVTTEQVPLAAAVTAVAVARGLGGSVAPTMAPPSAPPSPGAPSTDKVTAFVRENKWAVGIAALAVVILVWQNRGGAPQQATGGQIPGTQAPGTQPNNPGGGGSAGGEAPALGTGDNLPTLRYQQRRANRQEFGGFAFTLQTPSGPQSAFVGTMGNWQQTSLMISAPTDREPTNVGFGGLQLTQGRNGPARVGQIPWQRNGLNLPPMCLAFEGGQVQNDTAYFPGMTMCVLDASCQQSYGCGRIQ